MKNRNLITSAPRRPETITLGDILGSYELGLVLIAGYESRSTAQIMQAAVQWVHGSELADPSPFLTPRTVLLTTGPQFKQFQSDEEYERYVQSLVDVGVTALGFGVDVAYERIPVSLVESCDRLGLPLFRVPYDTPFIQISLTAARLLAAQSYERQTWSLDAQRSISRAAVRTRGVWAALETLSEKLDRWVAIASTSGNITYVAPLSAKNIVEEPWVRAAAKELATRGGHSNTSRAHMGARIHVQTIPGASGNLGTLIVESTEQFDHAERGVIEFASALASIYLEQQRALHRGESQIQNVIFTLFMQQQSEFAAEVMLSAGLGEVSSRVRICFLGPREALDQSTLEQLRGLVSAVSGSVFAKYYDDAILLVPSSAYNTVAATSEREGFTVGISLPSGLDDLQRAIDEARTAFQIAAAEGTDSTAVVYSQKLSGSIIALLHGNSEALRRAALLLAPLRSHDEKYHEDLEHTLRVWLQNNGQNSSAGAVLGVHRHTIANRIKLIFDLLKRDPNDPGTRAECWSALTLSTE